MGFLTMLGGPLIKAITDSFLGKALDAFTAYNNKQISLEELHTRVQQALLATFAEVEKAYADSLNKTFASFMDAARTSKFMQHVWGAVALSQLGVLLWAQVGIPALIYVVGGRYPSSGTTVDWAYALLALCLGGGAIALKTGPGSEKLVQDIRGVVGK